MRGIVSNTHRLTSNKKRILNDILDKTNLQTVKIESRNFTV